MNTKQVTIIQPKENPLFIDFAEIWHFRDLFYVLTWRDIKVRYKQTVIGIAWAIFQPIITMIIFTLFFGNLAKIPSGNLPYSLFVFCGLVYWNFFSGSLTRASNSLIDNENIIKKVYFPRLILPMSAVITNFIDFAINFALLILFSIYLKFIPNPMSLVIIPLGIIITILSSAGLGYFLAAFNIKYRDVRYILPFFIQLLMFLSPVIYPTNIIKPSNKIIMALNPMSGVIESVRAVISNSNIDWPILFLSFLSSIIIFLLGLYYFRRTERLFADIV
jgi:lipopolysaccharide transport system permease protein